MDKNVTQQMRVAHKNGKEEYKETDVEHTAAVYQVRSATLEDATELADIYRYYVEHTAITYECHVPDAAEFAARIQKVQQRFPYLVVTEKEKILGYAYASPYHEREAFNWVVELSIYLRPEARHKGIGKKLYLFLEDILKKQQIQTLYASIASTEEEDEHLTNDSTRFHEQLGYHQNAKYSKCGYKFEKWYDTIWMEKMIGEHQVPAPKLYRFDEIERQIDWNI